MFSMFDSIESSIGRENAVRLISNVPRRGKRPWRVAFYIPKRINDSHMLARTLGMDVAQRLCKDLGGLSIQTSNGNSIYRRFRNQEIRRMANQGMSLVQIAGVMNISDRMVRNIVGPSQGDRPCG